MSSREPMWFCHECHAEMRPLMTPDPICASCQSSFVEKLENPSDDPRGFHHHLHDFHDPPFPYPVDNFFRGLRNAFDAGYDPLRHPTSPSPPPRSPDRGMGGGGFRLEVRPGPGGAFIIGGPNTLRRSPNQGQGDNVPTMSEFLRREHGNDISGHLMAQYLLSLFGRDMTGHESDPFMEFSGGRDGRLGDYVFTQEALDQIMTQIMENSSAGRPVPATEEIIIKLPREILTEGCPLLQKDCAVCKEQFNLHPENDGDLIVVTLPCDHPFHQDCILPWLKSSGTCPVCRYQLVPQPGGNPGQSSRGSPPNQPPRRQSPDNSRRGGGGSGGLFQSLFGGTGSNSSGSSGSGSGNNYSSMSGGRSTSDNSHSTRYFPGHWTDGRH
ncbi:hypothetical protein EDC04DRAFT_3051288 [Pisolithus marmoratus]|nr:hypothetical protein EDC04DRAFT_3051288 [Pisolithus marmoratus]